MSVSVTAGCPSVRLSVCPVDRQQQRHAASLLLTGHRSTSADCRSLGAGSRYLSIAAGGASCAAGSVNAVIRGGSTQNCYYRDILENSRCRMPSTSYTSWPSWLLHDSTAHLCRSNIGERTYDYRYLFIYLFNIRSGVARNFRQGVRQSVAFLSVHPVQLPYQVGRTIKKRHDISYRLNEPKIMYFPDRWCVRPLRHLYGYATAQAHSRT